MKSLLNTRGGFNVHRMIAIAVLSISCLVAQGALYSKIGPSAEEASKSLHLGMNRKEVERILGTRLQDVSYIDQKDTIFLLRDGEPFCWVWPQEELWLTFDLQDKLVGGGGKLYYLTEESYIAINLEPAMSSQG